MVMADDYIYNPGNATFDLESPCMRPKPVNHHLQVYLDFRQGSRDQNPRDQFEAN
jgi:hypothetical protein